MAKSPLIFKDYIITEAYIKTNIHYRRNNDEPVEIKQDFKAEIAYSMDETSFVEIEFEIENKKNELPFELSITIVGFFELRDLNYSEEEYVDLLKRNAIAILFPYLRSAITDLTSKTNAFNPLILPPMNFVAMLEEENKITVQKLNDVID